LTRIEPVPRAGAGSFVSAPAFVPGWHIAEKHSERTRIEIPAQAAIMKTWWNHLKTGVPLSRNFGDAY
jgi:hypothetical protein